MAMSEIGTESDIGLLTTALNDSSRDVVVSCQVAVERIIDRKIGVLTGSQQ